MSKRKKRLLCRLSLHNYNNWTHSFKSCGKYRTCIHCGTRKEQKFADAHNWKQTSKSTACKPHEQCSNCGKERKLTALHNYGAVQHKSGCLYVKSCTRCGNEQREYRHNYVNKGTSRVENEMFQGRVEVLKCTRCGQESKGCPGQLSE